MKVIDDGHEYLLDNLDGEGVTPLLFVKREGDGYPGNEGHHAGSSTARRDQSACERAADRRTVLEVTAWLWN